MKRFLKCLVPLLLSIGILASIGWYLLVYDREFTRDVLISNARFFDSRGNSKFAATLYDLAYDYTGKDEDVAIELANQYRADGNYTKAEYTLTNAIADGGSVDLYIALCKTFVEQDKLLDAVRMLDSVTDPGIRMELDKLRPSAPEADFEAGYYSKYISISLTSGADAVYFTTQADYPSTQDAPYSGPIALEAGETTIYALGVDQNGLVSPLTILGYTIGGVIEEAVFQDAAMELAIRDILNADSDRILMTDELWAITEFTIPADTQTLDDLALLPYLQVLNAENQKLDSLSCFTPLKELKELHLRNCRLPAEDLTILAQLPILEKLTLSNCSLSTIANLSGAASLKYLDVSGNTLRNLDALSGIPTLQELYLQHNAITGLQALTPLANLEKLDISYNSITDLSALASCTKLSWLNAGNNSIATLQGLDAFPNLTHLDADNNLLTSVEVLSRCTKLTELNISRNFLSDIRSLCTLTELISLNCSYNVIEELPSWPEGSVLSILDASYNEIKTLRPLSNLNDLTYVYLDYNKLTTLDPIADCYRLVMVNAYGNEIEDVSKLTAHNIIVNYDPT